MSERAQLSGVSLCAAHRPDGSICGLPASIVGPAGGMVCLLHAPKPNMHPLAPPSGDALLLPLPEVMRRLRTHVSWGERTDGMPVGGDRFTPAIAGSVLAHIERLRDALLGLVASGDAGVLPLMRQHILNETIPYPDPKAKAEMLAAIDALLTPAPGSSAGGNDAQ